MEENTKTVDVPVPPLSNDVLLPEVFSAQADQAGRGYQAVKPGGRKEADMRIATEKGKEDQIRARLEKVGGTRRKRRSK